MPEQLLNFPQILSRVIKEDRGRAVAQPVGGDLPEDSARCPEPQVEHTVGERRARNTPET
jgi:hypothetical protein